MEKIKAVRIGPLRKRNFAEKKERRQQKTLAERIIACQRCPRLRTYCGEVAREKKREFRDLPYWGKPVPGFGDSKSALWIVGLAPAAHGANRTGRVFTGDSSGNWLFRAMHQTGFANQEQSVSLNDGLALRNAYVSAAARCAPPDNKPTLEEISNCSSYLDEEWNKFPNPPLILALGSIAFQSVLRLLERQGVRLGNPRPKFGHHRFFQWAGARVLTSYHPSRQNTQTGRLTEKMWLQVFEQARSLLQPS